MTGSPPSPERVGGLAWTRRTEGKLTAAERRRLAARLVKGQAEYLMGLAKLAVGYVPSGAANYDVDDLQPPDSALAREAESICSELPRTLAGHSFRTWMFGQALAALDGIKLDAELFYVSSLLHDYGMSQPKTGRDFTLLSAERTLECARAMGTSDSRANLAADAICAHTTPGISLKHDGALSYYIQYGAMADAVGLRIWDISRENIDKTTSAFPRTGAKKDLEELIRAEAKTVPKGRMALLVQFGALIFLRHSPLGE